MNEDGIRWPNGARCAVMFSFDFDAETNWASREPDNVRRPSVLSQGTYGAKVGVLKILELLKEEDIKATFFVPGWVADNRTDRVEKIIQAGHEVSHHGYYHKAIQPGDKETELEELERGLEAFKKNFGIKPLGYRAPYADTSPNLIKLLSEKGFLYDSTLMDDVRPYRHILEDGSPGPVELPWHWSLDDAVYMLYAVKLTRPIFTNEHVLSIWKKEFEEIHRWGGFFDLIMHPQATGRPSRLALLREFIAFTRQFEGVWYAPAGEIAKAWLQQYGNQPPKNNINPFITTWR